MEVATSELTDDEIGSFLETERQNLMTSELKIAALKYEQASRSSSGQS